MNSTRRHPAASHFTTFRGVRALRSAHPEVRRLKRAAADPSLHGNKVWHSSFALIDYLHRNPLPRGARVIDVGCGWGLTGVWLAKTQGARVLSIDADAAVEPYLQLQARINGVAVEFRERRFEQLDRRLLAGADLLIGSDICFWDEMVEPLYRLLRRAGQAGVGKAIIGDPGRPPFWALSERVEGRLGGRVIEHRSGRRGSGPKQLLLTDYSRVRRARG
jgi:predicted nicotinamide N-methyase